MRVLNIGLITLLPDWIGHFHEYGVTGKAVERGLVDIQCWNPRDYADNRYKKIDDHPYGGGAGMVMMAKPLLASIDAARNTLGQKSRIFYLTPQGKPITQKDIIELSKETAFILIAGRYEGIDERVIEAGNIEEYSIGDFIQSGGELPALCIIDSVIRLLPDVLGNSESIKDESFNNHLLEYPHYTRPAELMGMKVPAVLLTGNQKEIAAWRLKQSLERTQQKRPDLLKKYHKISSD